jgi:PAS domain S-box-containing protein
MMAKYQKLNFEKLSPLLFNQISEGLVVVDSKGNICLLNERIEELFGYSEAELIGKSIEILIPKSQRHKHISQRDEYIENPRTRAMGLGYEVQGLHKNSKEFPIEVGLTHIEEDGQKYVVAMVTDITLRKETEDQIRLLNRSLEEKVKQRTADLLQSQQLYESIAENFPEGTINVLDRDLNYIFAEGREFQRLGIDTESLPGTAYLRRYEPEVAAKIEPKLYKVLNGTSASFEIRVQENDYAISVVPLPDSSGVIDRILLVETNISKRKQAEREVHQALKKERELNELKTRFVSMASHEFRTPLSTIYSSAGLIRKYTIEEHQVKREKHVSRIRKAVDQLTEMLNDVLSLSKIDEGRIEAKPENIDLLEFLEEVKEETEQLLKSGQELHHHHQGGLEPLCLDPSLLRNILNNLLSNAIKYSPENSVIALETSIEETELKLTIRDKGMGIPIEDQPQLFERFFRAQNVTNIQGTGLGLHIVRNYLEIFKGEISFESEPGEGTTFMISIPRSMRNRS